MLCFNVDRLLTKQFSPKKGGLGFGVLWGFISKVIPERGDAYVIPIRTMMLFGGGLLAIYGSEMIHYEGAGPLAVVFAAFTSSYFWCRQGWELEDNPVATGRQIVVKSLTMFSFMFIFIQSF